MSVVHHSLLAICSAFIPIHSSCPIFSRSDLISC
nr:MAG TPA: hypothetical protein [Caudoviricetes sp.]